ncbi:hypothetical protein PMAYCL1PPCAC_29113 [Pristionchus mayeri]|uniref:Uncharacterized protein n=1 Tax=Pristionchus mayeri TaxID=1317129 RepID=A0AAN5IAL7_9BILA|nr:hypothetical protein PMAYCL1PPCAC_29113 [Pristionchus mayeri]
MSTISSNSSRGMVPNSSQKKEPLVRDRYRTCCDCCHIKTGTALLGFLEAVVLAALLYGIVQQLVWKSATYSRGACNSNLLRDCLLLDFSHFSLTLIFDYIIALLLVIILFSILLMFCGIFSDTSCLLFPHLFVQAIFLLSSVGYFVLYAWSYFYGDLYTHQRSFEIQSFIERMWLASLLLILASFQVYLFYAVFMCSLYLAKVDNNRRERETAFERLSERVRIAKENGLWRQNGVGGFLSYTRQEEDEKRKKERKEKLKGLNVGHVQWSNENKVVLLDEDPSRSDPLYQPSLQFQSQQMIPASVFIPIIEDLPSEPRRRSTDTIESRENIPSKGGRNPSLVSQSSSISRFGHSHSQKEREPQTQHVKRSESAQKTTHEKKRGDFPVRIPLDDEYTPATPPSPVRRKSSREEKLKEASLAAIANEKARRERERAREREREQREAEKTRTSSSSSPEKESRERPVTTFKVTKRGTEKVREKAYLSIEAAGTSGGEKQSPITQSHHHHHHHSIPSTSNDQNEERRGDEETEGRRKGSRALRKLRSVDSGEYDVPEEVFERRIKSRRRSSDAGRALSAVSGEERSHRHKKDNGPSSPNERKTHDSLVILKKISISATISPFA